MKRNYIISVLKKASWLPKTASKVNNISTSLITSRGFPTGIYAGTKPFWGQGCARTLAPKFSYCNIFGSIWSLNFFSRVFFLGEIFAKVKFTSLSKWNGYKNITHKMEMANHTIFDGPLKKMTFLYKVKWC